MTETPLDPRIQAFIRSRGKLPPVGVRCVVTPVQSGRYYVQAAQPAESGVFQDGEYFGNAPFQVTRNPRGRDIVECKAGETVIDARAVPFTYFYFALRAEWSYVDTDDAGNNLTGQAGYPFWLGTTGSPPRIDMACVSGKRTTSDPPSLEDSPYRNGAVNEADVISYLVKASYLDSIHTLENLWFYRAALTSAEADQTALTGPPPANGGATLTEGNWWVKFDVYEVNDGVIGDFVETKSYGPFVVPDSADPTDHTTWAQLTPGDDWTCTGIGVDSPVLEYQIKNLRIEQVT